jgi:hypothetical protein
MENSAGTVVAIEIDSTIPRKSVFNGLPVRNLSATRAFIHKTGSRSLKLVSKGE